MTKVRMTKRTLTLLAVGVTGILSVALLASAACSPFAAPPTPTPTKTPKPTFTPTFTATPTPKATATPTWTLVPSPTPRPPTKVPTATLKPTLPPPPPPTATPTPAATATPSLPYRVAYGRSEQNCGITDVRGTVWDASDNKKNGVVIWLSDESGNYKGFSYGPNGATGEDSAVGDGMYRITIAPGLKPGKWFVVVVKSKTDLTELSPRYRFETDAVCDGNGRQQWVVDFKANY